MKRLAKHALRLLQSSNLAFDEHGLKPRFGSASPELFNLDLHISVVADLKHGFANQGVDLTNWSISGSNRFVRSFFKLPDPVEFVNNSTWIDLNEELIEDFTKRYKKFLSRFDGFVVTHTPAFMQLFQSFNKPILVMSSTRYEAPYTNRLRDWNGLNNDLTRGVQSGRVFLASNNLGDRDYLKYFLGIESHYAPSFCDYTKYSWKPNSGVKLVICRSDDLAREICKKTGDTWLPFRDFMGSKYSWTKFNNVSEVFVIPYNISTMSYFEFSTSGIPVAVPSKEFLLDLVRDHPSILSELSYFQIQKLDDSHLPEGDPNKYSSNSFYDWWLDRADFYQTSLMPNVRQIDSFDELLVPSRVVVMSELKARNLRVSAQRSSLIRDFVRTL